MNLTVQGKPLVYDGEANLQALIEKMNGQPHYCTVRVNGEILQRRDFENMPVADGDSVDLLYFMGGGAAPAAHSPMTAPGTGPRAPQAQRELSDEEILRYSRHFLLPDFGGATQLRLCEAKVLVVGAGGLGSPALFYLAAAGVGTLGIIDDDVVDRTNLQRQILHTTSDVGRPKVTSAAETIAALNPNVNVVTHQTRLDEHNVLDLIGPYDVIVDGVDNFTARYLLNDACVMTGKTLVEAGFLRYGGLVMTIKGGESACYRCVFERPPPAGAVPTCQEAGVLGAVAGVVGTLQATEVVKVLTGVGEPLHGRLLQFDALRSEFYEVAVARRADCPVCGENPTITSLVAHELACGLRGGAGAASEETRSS